MIDTIVFDNLFLPKHQDLMEEQLLAGDWKFVDDMSYNKSPYPSYGFNQTFKHPTHGIISPLYENICVPIINKLIENINLEIKDITFCRAFLQVPLDKKFVKEHNGVHIDMPIPHYAVVYYCNDSDGDTIIYEQNTNDTPMGSINIKLAEHKRVTPKKGRIVIFDGSRYHCSSQPTHNRRMIVNFNLV